MRPDMISIDDLETTAAVVAELRLVRAAQARAWKARRPPPNACPFPMRPEKRQLRGSPDPLIALEQRAPFVAVVRGRSRARERLRLPTSGLLCVWRMREADDGEGRRAVLLTSAFIACRMACGRSRREVAAFVVATLEGSRACLDAMLDRELERALVRRWEDERAWRERRHGREAAIAAALRGRTRGLTQPWLFDSMQIAGDVGRTGLVSPGSARLATNVWSYSEPRATIRCRGSEPGGDLAARIACCGGGEGVGWRAGDARSTVCQGTRDEALAGASGVGGDARAGSACDRRLALVLVVR